VRCPRTRLPRVRCDACARRRLFGEIARAAADSVTAAIRALTGERDLAVGIVACLQTHGSRDNWHPHLHLLVTDGGSRPDGTFVAWPVQDTASAERPRPILDKKSCQYYHLVMLDIQVIDDPAAATVALEPVRSRLLSELAAPASAATLATRVGLARQKVNYHLHALEAHGLVRLAQKRKWGGLTERLLVATAASYVVSPSALGPVAIDPNREVDRLSASYLIALGARVVREVGDLVRRANASGKRLATLAVDTEVCFRSATDRAAFSKELTEVIARLVSKYHDTSARGGRAHRLVVVAHPLPQKSHSKEPS
jgi:DNA-binding transcriptional ArsR family regulator